MKCKISQCDASTKKDGSLVDGGANGGGLGEKECIILEHVENAHVDITGVADVEMTGLRVAQGASVVDAVHDGPVIAIVSQHAELKSGKTVHSKGQSEHFGMIVDDKSRACGGKQCMIAPEGHAVPIHVRDGLNKNCSFSVRHFS